MGGWPRARAHARTPALRGWRAGAQAGVHARGPACGQAGAHVRVQAHGSAALPAGSASAPGRSFLSRSLNSEPSGAFKAPQAPSRVDKRARRSKCVRRSKAARADGALARGRVGAPARPGVRTGGRVFARSARAGGRFRCSCCKPCIRLGQQLPVPCLQAPFLVDACSTVDPWSAIQGHGPFRSKRRGSLCSAVVTLGVFRDSRTRMHCLVSTALSSQACCALASQKRSLLEVGQEVRQGPP